MNNDELLIESKKVIVKLADSEIGSYIDTSLNPPDPFRGKGKIKLIVLGQDPTVQDPEHRKKIKVALLLNQKGSLKDYLIKICEGLDIDLKKNIYATNLLKNFFTIPPDKLRKENPRFFRKAASYWIPLLKEEIKEFEDVSILPLGEPVLNSLIKSSDRGLIRYYWGYEGPGEYGPNFSYIKSEENILSRDIFPFPHIPGLSHDIYRQQMDRYLSFMKKSINP